MAVSGRGLSAPVIGFTATAADITVRVDCDAHPEYWLTARFTKGQMVALLAEIESEADHRRPPAALEACCPTPRAPRC